jgi:prepilin-type N-terminal cleavage/methylation domain-containing protein
MSRIAQNRSSRSAAGFTMVELLIVVAMVAVLAAIAAPSWFGYLSRQRVRTVQNDLVEVLRQTQTKAVQTRSNQTTTILVNESLPTVRIGTADQQQIGTGVPGNAVTLSTNRTGNAITFDYQGIPTVATNIPFVVTVRPAGSPANSAARRCVAVATALGTIKTAQGSGCDALASL